MRVAVGSLRSNARPAALVLTAPKRRRVRKCDPEDIEQARVIAWADDPATQRRLPEVADLYAIPNGGFRHKSTAMRMRWTGARPGIPDLHLPVPRGPYASLYVEMKAMDGVLSPAQKGRIPRLERHGNKVIVAHGADKAIAGIEAYLRLPRSRSVSLVP